MVQIPKSQFFFFLSLVWAQNQTVYYMILDFKGNFVMVLNFELILYTYIDIDKT